MNRAYGNTTYGAVQKNADGNGPPESSRRPQKTAKSHRGILKFTENYVLKSIDCGTLQLVLGVV